MRIFVLALCFLCVPVFVISAQAQDNAPVKTWDPVKTPSVKPLNLKSILSGKRHNYGRPNNNSRRNGPTSRNSMELLKAGEELPYSRSLSATADSNDARSQLRLTSIFDGMDENMIEITLENIRDQEEENRLKQWERRNKFYIAHNMVDEHTREYLSTKQGRLFKREVRNAEREKKRADKQEEKLTAQKQKMWEQNIYKPFQNAEEDDKASRPSVVVPTARPSKDGTIKPFFYK